MSAAPDQNRSGRPQGAVPPVLPLSLLESIRAHDRPREVLEDEDLAVSLPRRLGLTGVVESQIQRYEEAARKGRSIPVDEVLDLFRLVLRRPDAEPILREAGARIAQRHFRRLPAPAVAALGVLPRAAVSAAARRSARSLLRRLVGPGRVEVGRRSLEARVRRPLTAQVDDSGTACVLFAAALEELVSLYTKTRPQLVHSRCEARGDDCCQWAMAE